MTQEKLRIAATADLHLGTNFNDLGPISVYQQMVDEMQQQADIILVCGDFCSFGSRYGAMEAVKIFANCQVPVIGVPGNHEPRLETKKILTEGGKITLLESTPYIFLRETQDMALQEISAHKGVLLRMGLTQTKI